jgi:hypothetical protein
MAEHVSGSGLLDLSKTPIADLPSLDEATVETAIDRLIAPCTSGVLGGGERGRIWQNYNTAP